MNKKKDTKIIKFPVSISEAERQAEAILFAAEEPLDIETIKSRMKVSSNIEKVLDSLQKQYHSRGINLVCITKKWSFRTSSNLSK